MRLHYLQHVPFEGLGYIERWAREKKYFITSTRLFAGDKFPSQDKFDFLVIMGGPMSVNDEHIFQWLKDEKEFVKNTIVLNKPVLGICLGAQIISKVLGSKVFSNGKKEIGWFSVKRSASLTSLGKAEIFPEELNVFQWHGETFDLPKDAVLLAESLVCKNQAFLYKDNVIGLQFHLETTTETINSLVTNCGDELVDDTYIQNAEKILSVKNFSEQNKVMENILELLTLGENYCKD